MSKSHKIHHERLIGFTAKAIIASGYPQRLEHHCRFHEHGYLSFFAVTSANGLTRHTTDWPTAVEWYNEEPPAARGQE